MPIKQPLFIFLFILSIVIAALHFLAFEFYFYWTFWWFDILMHFLGGLWISLMALWVLFLSGYITQFHLSYRSAFFVAIFSVIVIGIGWELFEIWSGISLEDKTNYLFDTTVDFIMNLFGALSGYLYVVWKYIKSINNII